jgi:hypothetical protein
MTTVTTLKLDANGDVDVSGGTLHFLTGAAAVAQSVQSRLRYVKGECYRDEAIGTDWWSVIGEKPNPAAVRDMVRRTILGTPGVGSLVSLDLTLDAATRQLTGTFKAKTDDGEEFAGEI